MEYDNKEKAKDSFGKLLDILVTLRSPNGCPWDKKQTPDTLKHNLIEESYEAIDAIDSENIEHECEELGDIYLLVSMIALIEEERNKFKVYETLDGIAEKLVRRHPHVFGDTKLENADQVLEQWQQIKENVEGREKKESVLDSVSRGLPPLERALKIQKIASKYGFDWDKQDDVWEKVEEELQELNEARAMEKEKFQEEAGDLLFSIVNICRFYDVEPATALHKANEKFIRRFKYVESTMKKRALLMSADTFSIMDGLWNEAKKKEKNQDPQ